MLWNKAKKVKINVGLGISTFLPKPRAESSNLSAPVAKLA